MLAGLRSSPACERNIGVIGDVLCDWFADRELILEVGAGTGQHAAHISGRLGGAQWQPTDLSPDVETIVGWAESAQASNVLAPVALDVTDLQQWQQVGEPDALFTANTLHIMPWPATEDLFGGFASIARDHALIAVYGPFHAGGMATSESNAQFDASLRSQSASMGIRDIEAVRAVAAAAGFVERAHYAMPANNNILIWELRR
ncbi:MAG: DUF938 domain-containing protein [Pseudomonadota bacterium]